MVDAIYAAVDFTALCRVPVLGPSTIDVHEVEQPGAIAELVEHSHGQQLIVVLQSTFGRL